MTSFGRALRGVVLVVVALLGLAAAGLWALSRREPHPVGLTVTGTIGQVDTARAQLAQAEAALIQARARLADTRIEAPVDGVVLRKNLEPGATAAPGAAIVTLVDPSDLWLRAYIPETDPGRVRIGQTARVTVDTFPGQPFEGRVTEVASRAEFTPRNVQTQKERVNLVFRVKVAIANPDGRLKLGMPADAVIATD